MTIISDKSNDSRLIMAFFVILLIAIVLLFLLADFHKTSILLVDFSFCLFCVYSFQYRLRYFFLLHPLIIWILSLFYVNPFTEMGDGVGYIQTTKTVLSFYTGRDDGDIILNAILTLDFKNIYFGFIPNILIPDYLFTVPSDTVYYLWQSCFFVILISVCLLIAKWYGVLRQDYLFCIILFSVVSPTFFEIGAAPTRHYFTFISIFLFYISFTALLQKVNLSKIIWVLISISFIAISKITLFIPIIMFIFYSLFLEKNQYLSKLGKYGLLVSIMIFLVFSFDFFYEKIILYREISMGGAATFGFLANVPFLSVFAKYIYALLSPFPWQNAIAYITNEKIYGGNPFFFIAHMLSSLTGIYFFSKIIVYAKPLFRFYPAFKPLLLYGLILSLSILGGETGFHGYLAIFFPFFSPLFLIKCYKIPFFVPVLIVLIIELAYSMAINFI